MSENQNSDLGRLYLKTKAELNRQSERAANPSTTDALAQMARPGWASTLTEADVNADPSVSAITPEPKTAEESWSGWYRDARSEMAFRYGLRRIPKDRYKEQFALGQTPHGGAREIYKNMAARGEL